MTAPRILGKVFIILLASGLTFDSDLNAQCDIAVPDLGCSPVTLPDTCSFCDDDALGLIVQLYINFPDQGPLEDYGITVEYGNENDGFQTYTNDFYDNGSAIQFFIEDTMILYLTEVVCPNGDIDTTDLGDTVYYFVTRAPAFDLVGPIVEACDSLGLPPIEGPYVPPDAAYYTEPGGNGTQYLPGDWIYESTPLYIYGTNGPCDGEVGFQIIIYNSASAEWTPPDTVCAGPGAGTITLTPNGEPGGIWSGPGITDNGDGTAIFDPGVTGGGDFDVTYSLSTSGCPSSVTQVVEVTEITFDIISVECDDNGTPSDETDDFYTATVTINGTNTGPSWSSNDPLQPFGNFGETYEFGNLLPNSTNIFVITDNGSTDCSAEFEIQPGDACGVECNIMITPGDAICNSNDTWFDGSDDLISQGLVITNGGNGGTFTANDPNNTTGQFGTITVFGPYDTDGQDLVITITSDDDPSCSIEWTIPHTCNVDCSIEDATVDNIECNDGGTPDDPTDDFITFSVTADGIDLSDGYFITSDVGPIIPTFGYFDETGTFQTPFGSAGTTSEITVTIIDFDNPECTFDITIDNLDPCSNDLPCEILDPGLIIIGCNDFGTPGNPEDDYMDIILNPTGTGLSGDYIVTSASVVVAPGAGTFGEDTDFQLLGAFVAPDPIIITITDNDDPNCSLEVEVPNLTPCSGTCSISLDLLVEEGCDDNGTPDDSSDDTFTFQILINGTGTGTGWTANDPVSTTGEYGFSEPFGPYLISDGTVTFTVTDNDDLSCTVEVSVDPPQPCSIPCQIDQPAITDINCNDNGTPDDPGDDFFTFNLTATGSGVSVNGFLLSSGSGPITPAAGQYNVLSTYSTGPGTAGGGPMTIELTDGDDATCIASILLIDSGPCSVPCEINAMASSIECQDNGTPTDPDDDVFVFDVTVSGTGIQWIANDPNQPTGEMGQPTSFGPYPIADGIVELILTDQDNPDCTDTINITPPQTCSDACIIDIELTEIFCDDNGTDNISSDDVYYITVVVSGTNTGPTWQMNTQVTASGEYDNPAPLGPFSLFQLEQLIFSDELNPGCTGILELGPLPGCSAGCIATDTTFVQGTSCISSEAGQDIEILAAADGCDSVVITDIILLPTDSIFIEIASCSPADTGTLAETFINQFGCDSTVITSVTLEPADTTFLNATTCDPADTMREVVVLTNVDGCDSVIITAVILLETDSTFIVNQTCDPADTNIIVSVLQNSDGCDSVVVIEPVFVENDTVLLSSFTCSPADTSTTVSVFTNSDGCDSIVIELVQLAQSDSIFHVETSCNFSDTGTVVNNLINSSGCDSIVTTLTIWTESDTSFIFNFVCNAADTGTVEQTFTGQGGCDSVVITSTFLAPSDTTFIDNTTCIAADTGTTANNLTSQFGCDSVVILRTVLLESYTTYVNSESCSPIDTGVTIEIVPAQNGCDSVLVTTISLIPSDTTLLNDLLCPDESILINNDIYDINNPIGIQTVEGQGQCDSVIIIELSFYDEPEFVHIDTTLCPGNSIVVNGILYDEASPTGVEILTSEINNCDSLILDIQLSFEAPIADYSIADPECNGLGGSFTLEAIENLQLPVRVSLNNDINIQVSSTPYSITELPPGEYEVEVSDTSVCFEIIEFEIKAGVSPTIFTDSVITIDGAGQDVIISTNFPYDSISWTPADFVECAECAVTTLTNSAEDELTVEAFSESGCSAAATIQLVANASSEIHAPNVFSPNGDGINDQFTLYTSDDMRTSIQVLAIFDRWGNKVFEARNITPGDPLLGWNGTFNGQRLDPGVFVFSSLVKLADGNVVPMSGDVTLVR